VLTGRVAISLGIIGTVVALVSGLLVTVEIANPGCGGIYSGFPIPWIHTPWGCPLDWSTDTVYAIPFLAVDALFYMGVGYAIVIIYEKRKKFRQHLLPDLGLTEQCRPKVESLVLKLIGSLF
jgi:hypothetical protein